MAKNKKEKKGIVKEFKEFALQGNLFDMAIGVIIGGVFKDLVTAFTNNIIMPLISIFTGGVSFDDWKIKLPTLFSRLEEVEVDGVMVEKPVENYQLLFFSMFFAHSNFCVMFWMEISFSSPSGKSV